MKDQKNYGRILENVLFENLKNLPLKKIYTEKELTDMYGWDASSVDFMLEFNNKFIFIQTKFLNSRRRESTHINKFLKSIDFIKINHNINIQYIGLWVCRLHPFDDNEKFLKSKNSYVISCFESITTLVNKTIEYINNYK